MKTVRVEVLPAHEGDVVTAVVRVEGGKAEGFENTVESGTPQASQTIKVQDEVQLDADQRAAHKRPIGEKAEEQKKKTEERQKRVDEEAKKEEERLEREMPEEAKLRKAQEKERDEKIQGRQDVKQHEAPIKADRGTQDPSDESRMPPRQTEAPGGRDAGLRHETPADSKSVQDHASTTKILPNQTARRAFHLVWENTETNRC